MSFLSLIQIMIRRWTVVLPMLFLTALAGLALIVGAETTFSLSGTELLVRAQEDGDSAGAAGRITPDAAGQIVSSAIDQPSFRRQFEQRGLLGDYVVVAAASTTVISVSITGDDEELVLSTAEALIDGASGALAGVVGTESAKDVRVFVVADPTLDDVINTSTQRSLSITLAVLESGAAVVNPFPPNQPTVRALLDLALRPAVEDAVEDVAPDVEYLVEAIPRDTAPILSFSVSSSDVDQLEPAYVALISALGDELVELQTGANVRSDLTVFQTLVPPTEFSRASASVVRSAVALALLGIGAAAALAVGVDGVIISRGTTHGDPLGWLPESASGSGRPVAPQQARPVGAAPRVSELESAAQKRHARSKAARLGSAVAKPDAAERSSRSTGSKSTESVQERRARSRPVRPGSAVMKSDPAKASSRSTGSTSTVSAASAVQRRRARSEGEGRGSAVLKADATESSSRSAGSKPKNSAQSAAQKRPVRPKAERPDTALDDDQVQT